MTTALRTHVGTARSSVVLHATTWTQRSARRIIRPETLSLALPPLVAAIVALTWFPMSRFLAAGDITPFIRDGPGHELTSYWSHQAVGTGATTPGIARAPEVLLIRVVTFFGGSEMVAQHLFYAALLAFVAFGAAYLARAFLASPVAVAAAGLLGAFNPFVLVRLPNPLSLLWLGLVATVAGMLVRVARGAPRSVLAFAAVTTLASYLSLNPPLLMTALVTTCVVVAGCSLLVGVGGTRRAARFVARSLPWVLGFNLWWLVPFALSSIGPEGVKLTAETRAEDWSWSHGQNSLPNIVALTADWGWRYPEYMPYARALDTAPWTVLRWILPLLALAAPFLVRGRRRVAALALLGAGVATAFVAKGLHAPLDSWNLSLYHHAPGYWLLREPVSKAGGALALIEVVLAAIAITALASIGARRGRWFQIVGGATLAAVIGLALAFPIPLWTGNFGSDGAHGLPTHVVAVPDQWRDVADHVNASPTRGKVLLLPLDPYYQVTTTWGFHGADELVRDLVRRPVLQLLPDGYYSPGGDAAEMMRGAERALTAGDAGRAATLLQMLGVSQVIVRHDLGESAVARPVADVGQLSAGMEALQTTPARHFGVADLYTLEGGGQLVTAPRSITGLARGDPRGRVEALADLGPQAAAVPPSSVPLDALSWEVPDSTSADVPFSLRQSGRYQVGLRETVPTRWTPQVARDGTNSYFELTDPTRVTLDGQQVAGAEPMRVPILGNNVDAVDKGGDLMVVHDGEPLAVEQPTSVRALAASAPAATSTASTPAETCGSQRTGSRPPTVKRTRDGLELGATGGLGCMTVPGPALSPDGVYRVRMQLRSREGSTTRFVCLWEHGPNRCAATPQPTLSRLWSTFDVAARADPGTTGLTLFVYADGKEAAPAKVEYRQIAVTPMQVVGAGNILPGPRAPASLELGRDRHMARVEQPKTGKALQIGSPLGDCAHSDARTFEEAGLAVQTITSGVRLVAHAHTACVNGPLPDAKPGGSYTLTLDARTVSGSRARLCVWQDGPNRCAAVDDLPGSADWRRYRTTVTLDPTTSATRLYLYADGNPLRETVTEYRKLEIRPAAPAVLEVQPEAPQSEPPDVHWKQTASDAFSVRTGAASGPQLLVLDEAFGRGWQADGGGAGTHITANGYANAWVVDGSRAHSLNLGYEPGKWPRLALLASIAITVGAFAFVLARRFRSRRRRGAQRA